MHFKLFVFILNSFYKSVLILASQIIGIPVVTAHEKVWLEGDGLGEKGHSFYSDSLHTAWW